MPHWNRTTLFLLIAMIVLAASAAADVNLCLYNGTATLNYQCYETELTCADVNIGLIIRNCDDLVAGGGGGGGIISDLHPEMDDQSVVGLTSYSGTASSPTGPLSDFVVLWESRDTFEAGRRVQAVARDASGALYRAEFDVAGLDRRSVGDLVAVGTPVGEEVGGAFDLEPTGRIAGGDMTVSVFVVAVNDPPAKSTVLEVHHTDITFDNLTWVYLSSGPVGNDELSWSGLKASYR